MQIPQFLEEMLQKQYNNEITNKIINGYKEQRNVTLRINTIKNTKEKIKECLNQAKIEFQEVEWNKDALIIKNAREEEIRKLEIYEKGGIYLQSLSSMLPPIIIEPRLQLRLLWMLLKNMPVRRMMNMSNGVNV